MTRARTLWLVCGLAAACDEQVSVTTTDTFSPDVVSAGVTDPLSMPETPTLDSSAFRPASACAGCHADTVTEWRTSHHAYAMTDPVFRALVAVRQQHDGGQSDRFCLQCHSAIATRSGEVHPGFAFDDLSPVGLEGVTCESCHRVTGVERTYNSGHRLDATAPIAGPHTGPVQTTFHESKADPTYDQSEFCAGCHDVVEVNGLPLERPFDEWRESPSGAAGETCQSCHMPARTGRIVPEGPERTLHSHRFVGVDVPSTTTGAAAAALDADVQALLSSAAAVTLSAVPATAEPGARLDLLVDLENRVRGHSLPTGSAFLRELWLHVVVTDAEGRVIYETGGLDAQGDLKGPFSETEPYADAGLIQLGARLIDATGTPTIFPWKAVELASTAIPAGHTRTYTLYVPVPGTVAGPLTVDATLRFRPVPPHVLRALGLAPDVETRELLHETLTVPVGSTLP